MSIFTLRVRKRLPEPVRHLLRLCKHIVPRGQASLPLPAQLLANCRICPSRQDLAKALPRGGRVAEAGLEILTAGGAADPDSLSPMYLQNFQGMP